MNAKSTAIILIAAMGAAIIGFLYAVIFHAANAKEAGGWILAGFLSIREVISKIEKIATGASDPVVEPTQTREGAQ